MIAGLEETTAGRDRHRRARRDPARPVGPRRGDGVPDLRALSAHDGRGEHGLRPADEPGAEGRDRRARSPRPPRSCGSSPISTRKPKALSGGQRQRVAIGRAIVRGPEVFLFDEPLSNLDAELRVEMRVEIARLHQEIGATMIYVTHDQIEAMTLADKIVVLRGGRDRAGRRAADALRRSRQRVRRGLHRQPAHELPRAAARRGRGAGAGLGRPGGADAGAPRRRRGCGSACGPSTCGWRRATC